MPSIEIEFIIQVAILIILLILLFIIIRTQSRIGQVSQQMPDTESFDNLSRRLLDIDDRGRQSFDTLSSKLFEIDTSGRQSFERLAKDLGELSRATDQMMDVGKTISSIEDLLKPPKLRGNLGETLLEQLLSQILHKKQYDIQYRFKNGETVDAIIKLGDQIVPVDSKFPLESFRRMLASETPDVKERKAFIRSIKSHVDSIANKYILPDEGTYDFALMYIPAENIYYETIISDSSDDSLYAYATEKRVIPVSPYSFYAYLQVIVFGLRGLQIEQQAQEIMTHLSRLQGDQKKLREDFSKLGNHLKNARNKFEDAERKLAQLEDKLLNTSAVQEV